MNKIILSIFALVLLIPKSVLAQIELREINISPFLQELEVAKGSSVRSSIIVSNNSTQELTVTISTKDFLPGNRGEPIFVPDQEFNDRTFSLASWIEVEGGNVTALAPQSSKEIFYTVNPPTNAEEGTHYGAVLFSYSGDQQLSGVGITQSIGTIVLVGYGEARSQGRTIFSVDHNLEWLNNKFRFTNLFSNTGNVHVKPKGEIQIKNIFGQVVGTSYVNRDADNVLPKSDRTFISEWTPGNLSFGPYRANLILTYGRERLELREQQTMWVFPIYFVILIVAAIIILVWFVFHGRHWHRRKIIDRHLKS